MPIAIIEEKLRGLPEEYLFLIANYIDSLKARIEDIPASGKEMSATYANLALIEKEKVEFAEPMMERYDSIMTFVQKYKGSIHRKIDEKSELAAYRNEKYASVD